MGWGWGYEGRVVHSTPSPPSALPLKGRKFFPICVYLCVSVATELVLTSVCFRVGPWLMLFYSGAASSLIHPCRIA